MFICTIIIITATAADSRADYKDGAETLHAKIPLLLSESHADHFNFLFERCANMPATLLVLDAHADTVLNENYADIRRFAHNGEYEKADLLLSNHNWIHPLYPRPVTNITWVSKMHGAPNAEKLSGFYKSTSLWGDAHLQTLSIEELHLFKVRGETLFVSIDLDFFYSEDHRTDQIPRVLDALFAISCEYQARGQAVLWAICISRPWLPSDKYAWTLLETTLLWLAQKHPEYFTDAIVTIFNKPRFDQTQKAKGLRAEGKPVPDFWGKEEDAPKTVKELLKLVGS
jgi:hypothetical protein